MPEFILSYLYIYSNPRAPHQGRAASRSQGRTVALPPRLTPAACRGRGASGLARHDPEVLFVAEARVLFHEGGKAAAAFGVNTMPSSFVVDRSGIVRYVHSGYHPDDWKQLEREVTDLLLERP